MVTQSSPPARRAPDGPPPPGPTGSDVDPIRPAQSVAHNGYTVLVCRADGGIDGTSDGLYDLDTRILSRHDLRLDGERPRQIGSCVSMAGHWSSTLVLRRRGGTAIGPQLPQDTLSVHLDRDVGCGMVETITIRNESMVGATTQLTIDLDADLVDRLHQPAGWPGPTVATEWAPEDRRLTIIGRSTFRGGVDERGLAVTVEPRPASVDPIDGAPTARRLGFALDLGPMEGWQLVLRYDSFADGQWRDPDDAAGRSAAADAWRERRTRLATAECLAGPAVERAAEDLLALRLWELEPAGEPDGWVVTAGVPSFTGYFGRDTITAGVQALLLGPEPLIGALDVAARTQGTRSDPLTEEEPGRMVHEMRRGPLSMLGVRPHRAYYGSYTTGSIFLIGLSELWHWTGNDAILRRYRDAAMRVIEWAETDGDLAPVVAQIAPHGVDVVGAVLGVVVLDERSSGPRTA